MLWADAEAEPGLLARVQWARVKSARRAIEKLYRSYGCDVSRLLDCCRQVRAPVVGRWSVAGQIRRMQYVGAAGWEPSEVRLPV